VEPLRCFAGLSYVTLPVFVGGQLAAWLLVGRVFRGRAPTIADFDRLVRRLRVRRIEADLRACKAAFFQIPVFPAAQFDAVVRFLSVMSGLIAAEVAERQDRTASAQPAAVLKAGRFIDEHAAESFKLRDVAQQAGVCPQYFCSLFKQATGLRFTEYVSVVRVRKAQELLADRSKRVSEVAHEAGFGSISHFNRIFRKRTGLSPTAFRTEQRPTRTNTH
jgi:AraC-like DNA-binding protein